MLVPIMYGPFGSRFLVRIVIYHTICMYIYVPVSSEGCGMWRGGGGGGRDLAGTDITMLIKHMGAMLRHGVGQNVFPSWFTRSVVLEWEWDLDSVVEWESEEGLVGGLDLESAVAGCVLVSVGVVGVVGVIGGFCAPFSPTRNGL